MLIVHETFAEFALLCGINMPKETNTHKSFCGARSPKRAIKNGIYCSETNCPRLKKKYKMEKLHLKQYND